MRIGNGELAVRPTNVTCTCRVCGKSISKDEVYGTFHALNFHRQCMKMWLEYSYDVMPITRQEMDMDPTGNTARIEMGRSKREWDEYRQALIDRLMA